MLAGFKGAMQSHLLHTVLPYRSDYKSNLYMSGLIFIIPIEGEKGFCCKLEQYCNSEVFTEMLANVENLRNFKRKQVQEREVSIKMLPLAVKSSNLKSKSKNN